MEFVDEFQRKNVLDIRPSMTVSKNIKRKALKHCSQRFLNMFEMVLKNNPICPLGGQLNMWWSKEQLSNRCYYFFKHNLFQMKCCLFCWSVVSSISWWRLQCTSDEFETCTIQVLQLHKFKEMIGEWVSVMKEWILNKLIARVNFYFMSFLLFGYF